MPVMAVNNQNQHEETGDYRSRPRWSAGKKMDAVLRLLRGEPLETLSRELGVEAHRLAASPGDFLGRGEPLETLSRELGVEAHRLAASRDDFLESGKEGLKGQRPDRSPDERALRQAQRKIGQLSMENEGVRDAL